jgi:hypothetical protein
MNKPATTYNIQKSANGCNADQGWLCIALADNLAAKGDAGFQVLPIRNAEPGDELRHFVAYGPPYSPLKKPHQPAVVNFCPWCGADIREGILLEHRSA